MPFLSDILQLDAVSDMMLFSLAGEMLYGKRGVSSTSGQSCSQLWKNIVASLESPQTAEFVYNTGRCLLFRTSIGCLILFVTDESKIEKIKSMCGSFQLKVEEPAGRKRTLLQLLAETDDTFKPQILHQLSSHADQDVAHHLLSLLEHYTEFKEEVRESVLLLICRILGDCSVHQAIPALQRFIRRYEGAEKPAGQAVVKAARVSIKQLQFDEQAGDDRDSQKADFPDRIVEASQEKILPRRRTEKEALDRIERGFSRKQQTEENEKMEPSPEAPQAIRSQQGSSAEEQRIRHLLKEGKKQEAAGIIMRYIEAAARQRMFDKAEKLRDKLIEIDSMMLTEIIRAAEIIEEAKATSINKDHLAVWHILVELLTQEEFSALYHAMTLRQYKNGEIIVQRGTFLAQLLFVNSGQVQVTAHVNGRDVFLKNVEAGEVVGGSTFFEASVWTVDARSMGAEILILPRRKLEQLRDNYPALESKLIDFSAMFASPDLLFSKTKKSRRQFERKPIEGRAAIQLLGKDGKETGVRFKGELFDISRGGVSFFMRVSKKKNADM
ncbi:MAG: cyclic nucleotide-binding domain-containing protein, partial [Desulfopila sp.]|nr:cyclic nucleotide-binding domain-containing protein [Desulfopila sp.]